MLNKPILHIRAKHCGNIAINGSSTDTNKLELILYLAVIAKIVLLHNLYTKYNLVNGSTGIIKIFILLKI